MCVYEMTAERIILTYDRSMKQSRLVLISILNIKKKIGLQNLKRWKTFRNGFVELAIKEP